MTARLQEQLWTKFSLDESLTTSAARGLDLVLATMRTGTLTLVTGKDKAWVSGSRITITKDWSRIADEALAHRKAIESGNKHALPLVANLPSGLSDGAPDVLVTYILLWDAVANTDDNRQSVASLHALLCTSASAERLTQCARQKHEQLRLQAQDHAKALLALGQSLGPSLGVVASNTDMLAAQATGNETREQIDQIRKASGELMLAVESALDYAQSESGGAIIEQQAFDLSNMLSILVSEFRPSAAEKGIDFQLRVPPQIPRWVTGDRRRTQQVLANLTRNAIASTSGGKVILDVHMATTGVLHAEISDSGRGIPQEELGSIFLPFALGTENAGAFSPGAGLSLATARSVLSRMDGRIAVNSALGEGSTFIVDIPLSVTPPPDPSASTREPAAPPSSIALPPRSARGKSATTSRVLLAEDCAINQRLVKAMLKHLGAEVELVNNGQLAVERSLSGEFTAVLMDGQMPGMDGLTAIKEIRQREAASNATPIAIVALTARAEAGDRETWFRAGADDYINKPVRLTSLKAMLDRWVTPRSKKYTSAVDEFALRSLASDEGADFVAELVNLFREDAPLRLTKMRAAVEQNEMPELALQAHALKGGALNLAASRLSGLASDVEDLARDGDAAAAARLVLEIEREYGEVEHALKRQLAALKPS
jgi:signal transduction histidine kinase/DNA-binding response OmpR family regulator